MTADIKSFLFAILFFLDSFKANGFVAKDPGVRLRIAAFQSTSSVASIDPSETDADSIVSNQGKKIPIHLLAGFLGSGKTTTLKHVLENKEDIRVGVIVNDVASVNIDAKLISGRQSENENVSNIIDGGEGSVVELQNGCACCSLAGELFDSIEALLQSRKESPGASFSYDAILVELSGVADPLAIQNNWKESIQKESNTFVTDSSQLGNVVTLVDATTFGNDYMTFDILKDRDAWFESSENNDGNTKHPHALNRQVVELLAEQVEAADLIVVNKEDLAGHEKVEVTKTMAQILNKEAKVIVTSHGKIAAKDLLGITNDRDIDREDIFDDADFDSSHSQDHEHSHDHNHGHSACDDPNCTDPSHDHSHPHTHSACDDPNCTDPSHDHSHSHHHGHAMTSTDNLGISSFVYKANRPFEPKRLSKLLLDWPIPIKGELDFDLLNDTLKSGYGIDIDEPLSTEAKEPNISPFVGVLRSKGFCWIAPTAWEGLLADPWRHDTAMYWSHAGKHFGLEPGGQFWDSLPRAALEDFFAGSPDPESRINKILQEDFVTEEFGDRRQEVVFIGVNMRREDIETNLERCLMTDSEMEDYRKQLVLLKDSS